MVTGAPVSAGHPGAAAPEDADAVPTTPSDPDDDPTSRPDVPPRLNWPCTLMGAWLATEARDQQLRRRLDEAGLSPTSSPRVGAQVHSLTVEGHDDVLLLLIDDASQQHTARPARAS